MRAVASHTGLFTTQPQFMVSGREWRGGRKGKGRGEGDSGEGEALLPVVGDFLRTGSHIHTHTHTHKRPSGVKSCQAHLFTEPHDDRPAKAPCRVHIRRWQRETGGYERVPTKPCMACRCLNRLVVRVSGRLHRSMQMPDTDIPDNSLGCPILSSYIGVCAV